MTNAFMKIEEAATTRKVVEVLHEEYNDLMDIYDGDYDYVARIMYNYNIPSVFSEFLVEEGMRIDEEQKESAFIPKY